MKQTNVLRKLTLGIMLLFSIAYSSAQISKIAIISLEDTTLVHQHIGFTIFTNFTDTLNLDIAVKQHLEQQLVKTFSQKYEVTVIDNFPDSIVYQNKIWGGLTKNFKTWITNMKDQYEYVIIVENLTIPIETRLIIPNKTSGLYSRAGGMSCYTTITFNAYRTADLLLMEFFNMGGKLLSPIKTFKLPKDKKALTPDMLALLKDGFIKHLDCRVEHFWTKFNLLIQKQINELNTYNP